MTIPRNLSGQALYNFIGGRRAYNASRKFRALDRRYKLRYYWAKNPHLCKADLARHFGVHRSTITRDIQKLKQDEAARRLACCPMCKGSGKLDTGPGYTVTLEWLSDVKRTMPGIMDRVGLGS